MQPSRVALLGALALAVLVFGAVALAAPKPSLLAKSWELDFTFRDPERISVTLPGDDHPTTFWFMVYTVTNNSGQDQGFYPSFDLVTDTLQVVTGGDNVHPAVVESIRSRYRKLYPFFVDPLKVSGTLLQGTDNARTSAVVFQGFDPSANQFTIYVGGLSGEVQRLQNFAFDSEKPESDENPRFFVLRKTLGISYDLPGDEKSRPQAKPVRVKREWVMR